MRKVLSFILVLALLSGAAAALADVAGTPIGSDQELLDVLAAYRAEGTTEFRLDMTAEYYEKIKDGWFARFDAMLVLAGAEDAHYQYSFLSGDTYLIIETLKWGEITTTMCASQQEVADAVAKYMAEGRTEFTIMMDDEALYETVRDKYMILSYAAQNGAVTIEASYTFRAPYRYMVKNVEYDNVPYVVVKDGGEFSQALAYMAEQNAKEFRIVATPEFYSELRADDDALWDRLVVCSPLENYRYNFDWRYRYFEYIDVDYSDAPRIVCSSEEDMVQAIRQMGASGISSFNLILTKDLFESIYQGFRFSDRLYELHSEAGMTDCNMKYSDSNCVLYYTDAVIHADVVKLSTPQEANEYVAQCVAQNMEDITLFCTPELYTTLIGNINAYVNFRVGMSPIFDTTSQAGIYDFELIFSAPAHMLVLQNCKYYPGTKIVNAVRSGDTSGLTDREKATMEAAQAMAARCKKDDPLETARAIHDELCAMITYHTDDEKNEGDTAIGCLLNGVADCDGYADGFYLVGTLAGLNVRYQHGDSHDVWGSLLSDVTHMWNLLEIDGTWRLVDLTWDDGESGPMYTWFNLGEDRASRMHVWNAATSVPLLPETDLSARPANEYLVTGKDDAYALPVGCSQSLWLFSEQGHGTGIFEYKSEYQFEQCSLSRTVLTDQTGDTSFRHFKCAVEREGRVILFQIFDAQHV